MDKLHFAEWLGDIYSIFGKAKPGSAIMRAVYERVEELPDGFFQFAKGKISDYDDLPRNMGKLLKTNLWPEYLALHPEMKSRADLCPECDGKGVIEVRLVDPKGRPGHGPDKCFRCVCLLGQDEGWTWERIHEAGYQIEPPAPQMKEKARQALARLGVRLGEIPDDRADQRRDRSVAVW